MHAIIHAADIQDRDGGVLLMGALFGLYPFLLKLYADSGYQGPKFQAGLRAVSTLIDPSGPYVSADPAHQGLLLHSVYHWPNGWDYVPPGAATPRGESSQWGDYHLREVALYVKRLAEGAPYLTFFGPPLDRSETTDAAR